MRTIRMVFLLCLTAAVLVIPPAAFAQEQPATAETEPPATDEEKAAEAIDDLQAQLDALKQSLGDSQPGATNFLLTGYGFTNYTDRDDEGSTFSAGLSPIFLWKTSDRLFFEGELELELEDDETMIELEYADIAWFVNDNLTANAGLFLTPLGTFSERLHPAWINKLPDAPLAFGHDGLVPTSSLGFALRGGRPLGNARLNYALYVVNGPRLVTPDDDEAEAGMLEFENFSDNNDNKALGGRLGFLPAPGLEVGYGFYTGDAGEAGTEFENAKARIQAVDFSFLRAIHALGGTIELRGEWIWSEVTNAEALGFGNDRDGGYLQLAYRSSRSTPAILKSLEGVVRYDELNLPSGAPENEDSERWTIGVNYWLSSSAVIKLAWQRTESSVGGEMGAMNEDEEEDPDASETSNALLLQFAIGF